MRLADAVASVSSRRRVSIPESTTLGDHFSLWEMIPPKTPPDLAPQQSDAPKRSLLRCLLVHLGNHVPGSASPRGRIMSPLISLPPDLRRFPDLCHLPSPSLFVSRCNLSFSPRNDWESSRFHRSPSLSSYLRNTLRFFCPSTRIHFLESPRPYPSPPL